MPDSDTDAEPLQNSNLQGTESSSGSFYDEIAPQAIRYAVSIVRKWADAEEIVQEAFCRLIQSNSRSHSTPPNDPASVDLTSNSVTNSKAVLFSIVRNLAIDLLRKNGRRRFEPVDTHQLSDNNQATDQKRLESLETQIQESLRQMPSEWADALQLKINGQLSYTEIASVLKATHGQVRTWIYRARKQLESDLVRQGLMGGDFDD